MIHLSDDYTIEDLEILIVDAKRHILLKQEAQIQSVYFQMVQLASNLGLSIDDVILRARRSNPLAVNKIRVPVSPRYRNPNNPLETWTGRGKSPKWVLLLESQGISRDRFMIN